MSAALGRLRARGGRVWLVALGVVAAAAMLGAALTVAYSLRTGFDRAAERADLPDVIARFDEERLADVDERIRALPNLEARAYRYEIENVEAIANGRSTDRAAIDLLRGRRQGYAVVEGRDVGAPGEVLVERGLATEWGLRPGDPIEFPQADAGPFRIVGIAVSPDNVAYPLAKAPRIFVDGERFFEANFAPGEERVTKAALWLRDPARLDVTLAQARAGSFGIDNLRFITRDGVRVLLDRAGGIVVALLVGFSLVALAAAGLMLAASAHAEVQRQLTTVGVLRAVGFTRGQVARRHALDATLVALPAAAVGLALGAAATAVPTGRLLEALNELGPGAALLWPLLGCLLAVVALVSVTAAWPAWRAAGRPPATILRGADLAPVGPRRRLPAGFLGLGARLLAAHRARTVATVGVLAVSAAVILLMLSLAGLLESLRDDPALLGKRYSLTAALPESRTPAVRALPGVADATPRYQSEAADSFQLGETLRVVGYRGQPSAFEAPPLARGRRAVAPNEAEVGLGLATAVGVAPGGTLALQLPSGGEARFRVTGVVRALENDGRIAYVRAGRLLAADPTLDPTIAVRLAPGADRDAVVRGLAGMGAVAEAPGAATSDNRRFLSVLANLLRTVALVNALVCLYVLVQVLALTARERRQTVATLRAGGAGRREVALLFAGAAGSAVVLAVPLALVLERFVLGPAVTRVAADYASLPLLLEAGQVALVVLALCALALLAGSVVGRRIMREPIVAGLRDG